MTPLTKKPKKSPEAKRIRQAMDEAAFHDFLVYLRSPWRIMWSNFLGGIFRGLGIIVGMTVVFAVAIWALAQFVNFPLIGEYIRVLLDLLQQSAPVTSSGPQFY